MDIKTTGEIVDGAVADVCDYVDPEYEKRWVAVDDVIDIVSGSSLTPKKMIRILKEKLKE